MSQTRRKGITILQDELNDIMRVVKSHSENVTHRLEKVKDMAARYCSDVKASASASPSLKASASASLPKVPSSSLTASTSSLKASTGASIPTPTVLGPSTYLNTVPEETSQNLLEEEAPELATGREAGAGAMGQGSITRKKSKGPVSWMTFRTKVGEGTTLKTGETATLKKISSLWEQAKGNGTVGDIERFLIGELHIEPSVAAQKAPELEAIARAFTGPERAVKAERAVTMKAPKSSTRVTRKVKTATAAAAEESQENWQKRMNKEGLANYEQKTKRALNSVAEREKVIANAKRLTNERDKRLAEAGNAKRLAEERDKRLAATRVTPQTPGKNLPGVTIPTLVPYKNTVINGVTYKLNPSDQSLFSVNEDGSIGEYVADFDPSTGKMKSVSL